MLNQQELFHYYDEIGTLRTVPIVYKPVPVRAKETYSFDQVVCNSMPAVWQVLSGEGPPLDVALMNTGDGKKLGVGRNLGSGLHNCIIIKLARVTTLWMVTFSSGITGLTG